jgi:hypothetical protein
MLFPDRWDERDPQALPACMLSSGPPADSRSNYIRNAPVTSGCYSKDEDVTTPRGSKPGARDE